MADTNTFQMSTDIRAAQANSVESVTGTSPWVQLFSGSRPANPAAADAGTLLAEGQLPSDWLTNPGDGTKALSGTWNLTGLAGAGSGTVATYFRIKDSAKTVCHMQGTCGGAVMIPTTASTASGNAVLTFSSTTGVSVGMRASGTGVPANTRVTAVTGTTVTLDDDTTGVSNGATVTFAFDMTLDNANIANAQAVSVTSFVYTQGNA